MSDRQYKDVSGNPCTLLWLVKNEPEWAENQIRHRDTLERELAAAKERIARLEDSLTSIREYWNRDNNDRAMEDACWHAINTASEALDTKEAKP